jgi:molecular chaperone GrpE
MSKSSKKTGQGSEHTEPEIVHDEAASQDAPKGPPPLPLSEGEQLQAAIAERDENKDHWLRTQAELDNFRKRVKKEADQNRLYQSLSLVRDLLPGLDNLERAITAAEKSDSLEGLLPGVRMVFKQFEETLDRYSVKPIAAVGEPFDPNLHEAVQQIPTADHPPMTVMQEVERGFQLHDRVIRPSKVIVSAALPEPADGE